MDQQSPSLVSHLHLVDLRLFVRTVEECSLTRGAERSFLSISAASQRIKNLEEAVGTKLLFRTKRGVSPTEAGEVFLNHAVSCLQQIARMQGELQAFSSGVRGHVRLFASTTAVTEALPDVLGEFLTRHESITVDLQERFSSEIVRAVHEGMADVGVLFGTVPTHGLETLSYRTGRLVLAVPSGHALSSESFIHLADTLEYDYVGLNAHSALHKLLQHQVSVLGRSMRVRMQVNGFDALCRLIESNVGIGVLPEVAANRLRKIAKIHIVQLLDEWAEWELRICVRKADELPLFAHELIDFLVRRKM